MAGYQRRSWNRLNGSHILSESWVDQDRKQIAHRAGVTTDAVDFVCENDVIDLHVEPYLPYRLYNYDLFSSHGLGVLRGRLMGHLDFPRIRAGGLAGGMWSITTNIARGSEGKWKTFLNNVQGLHELMKQTEGEFKIVRTASEYASARRTGAHAAMLVVQGGNALEAGIDRLDEIPNDSLVRVTLVHLTNSPLGITSSPLRWPRGQQGLSDVGKKWVEVLNERNIFVDLAHINRPGFWDAVEVHDREKPILVTHTGVDGVCPHWRNLDDDQIRAVSNSGGTTGIIFAKQFLKRKGGPRSLDMVLEHLEYAVKVGGEDHVSIGSDLDGFITPPPGLRDGDAYLRLVQGMIDRGWSLELMLKVASRNFLRTFEQLRP